MNTDGCKLLHEVADSTSVSKLQEAINILTVDNGTNDNYILHDLLHVFWLQLKH